MTGDQQEPQREPQATPAPAVVPPSHVTVESSELFRGHREILIQHGDEIYRLRITRNEKLILHK